MASYPIPAVEHDKLLETDELFQRGERIGMSGLFGASPAFMAGAYAEFTGRTVLVVTADEQEAADFQEDLEFFSGREALLYPAFDLRTTEGGEARQVRSERLAILGRLAAANPPTAVVLPVSALIDPLPPPGELNRAFTTIEPGRPLAREELTATLAKAGYESTSMVTTPGEFSVRGGIIDLFPMAAPRPLRIELYDDEVESVREIDPESQRSVAVLERVDLPLPPLESRKTAEGCGTPVSRHIPAKMPVFVLEPQTVASRLRLYAREFAIDTALVEAAHQLLSGRPGADLSRLPEPEQGSGQRCLVLSAQGVGRALTDLPASIEAFRRNCSVIQILCQVKAEAERLRSVLRDQGVKIGRHVRVVVGRVSEGFQFPAFGFCCVNHHELFQRRLVRRHRPKERATASRALESIQELRPGDLVVHLVHGIARYEGLNHMQRENGGLEDFMVLVFKNEVALYVPVSKIHLVHRYVGAGETAPKLDRIGSGLWSKRKARVAEALEDVAADLLETQAYRAEERGHAFPPDDDLQRLFDDSFPYEDTVDQIESIVAIKRDLESSRPMDRLLCGDVGFGKTEMAIRAAFKAVCDGRQAAFLVPTTILAEQHFETCRTRFADYPVVVEVLSRFQSRKRQAEIVAATRKGQVDLLVGTHRLLSADVGFKDLGLLVIDEEQRFGVRHKERLKKLKRVVDVLTMTATPIPRTLHMALVGLRDISSLDTAPVGRMAVHTQVEVRNDNLIRRALLLEVGRGGQAFFLHNRVGTIARETEKLRSLLPSLRIAFGHGQMRERELKDVITRFLQKKIDVLVCTTIIESGIDMPAVNTIIIHRADTFGLADLHQLRGRVGRGNVKAYCYLLVPHRHVTSVALRRLKAIEELSHLGAGFNIALKDLEIRGAGNILGSEQHGHIAAVGYDLYCRLLKDTIEHMKADGNGGRAFPGGNDVAIDVDLDIQVQAFLPVDFIPNEGQRITILRRLSECRQQRRFQALRDEIRDRYGPLPREVDRLVDLFEVRAAMERCGIRHLARVRDSQEVLVYLFDAQRYARSRPFRHARLNTISPEKAVLVLPRPVREPDAVLEFLKSQLMRGRRPV